MTPEHSEAFHQALCLGMDGVTLLPGEARKLARGYQRLEAEYRVVRRRYWRIMVLLTVVDLLLAGLLVVVTLHGI